MLAGAITAAVVAAVIAVMVTVIATRDGSAPAGAAIQPSTAPASSEASPEPTPRAPAPRRSDKAPPTPQAAQVVTSSARLDDVQTERAAPVSLVVGAIGVAGAPIDAVGVEPDGSMEIPVDISRIGWYEYGPAPGDDDGSAVLTAHIDSRTQGRGVFYHLDALSAGDAVEVGMSDGTTRTFVVDEIRQIPKVDLPTGDIFRRDGQARLALITCGGEFDESSRHYRDNIVVFASPT